MSSFIPDLAAEGWKCGSRRLNFRFLVLYVAILFSAIIERELKKPRGRNEYVPPFRSTAENKTWLKYKKLKIQAPGTTFSTLSDNVRYEGGHDKCCRFGTLAGVHQEAHIYAVC